MMGVRCGRCSTEFPVEGAGRHPCPACGAVNEVRSAAAPSSTVAQPPLPPSQPSPKTTCQECEFTFIVGDLDVVPCPNCGADVTVGRQP